VEDAQISSDFTNDNTFGKTIRPIIFSHDYAEAPNMYSGFFSDLASQGYIVFAQYHTDGTCTYTETSENEPILF
jgi:hypothetical protein